LFAAALRNNTLTLKEFDDFATLNAELATLPLGRTLGRGVDPGKREHFCSSLPSLKRRLVFA
jgi:hypothetical protein